MSYEHDFKTFLVRIPMERCFVCDETAPVRPRQLSEPSTVGIEPHGALECTSYLPTMNRIHIDGGAGFTVCAECMPRADVVVRAALEGLPKAWDIARELQDARAQLARVREAWQKRKAAGSTLPNDHAEECAWWRWAPHLGGSRQCDCGTTALREVLDGP